MGRRKRNNKREFWKRRNKLIESFFKEAGYPDTRTCGDTKYPNVILENRYKIPTKVYSGTLELYKDFKGGDLLYSIDVVEFGDDPKDVDISNVVNSMNQQPIFKIKICDIGLYVHNFSSGIGSKNRYPLFAVENPMVIYTEEHAKELVTELERKGYNCFIEYPNE